MNMPVLIKHCTQKDERNLPLWDFDQGISTSCPKAMGCHQEWHLAFHKVDK